MSPQSDQTWALLKQSGIVQGEQPENQAPSSPWYVKVLLAFSGWLAAIFILGFIGALFEFVFRNSGVAFTVGALMIASAFGLLRASANEFVEHLGLAASMTGQALIIYAVFEFSNHNEMAIWLLVALLQSFLVVLMPNFVHCVFSALVAAIAFSMALRELNIAYLSGGIVMFSASFCWLNEFRYPALIKKIRAAGYGLVLALVVIKGTDLIGFKTFAEEYLQYQGLWDWPQLGEIIIGMVTLYVVWSLLQRYGQPLKSRLSITALTATLLICALSTNVQGITVGMVIICLGFYCANRVLLGLGIVSLLFYISSYYYTLHATLLDKSQSLFMVGLILLFVRWLMQNIIPATDEAQHE